MIISSAEICKGTILPDDAAELRKILGIMAASALTPAFAVLSFLLLFEIPSFFSGRYEASFSLLFLWYQFSLILVGYIFFFWMIPVAMLFHYLLEIPLFSKNYPAYAILGAATALLVGASGFAQLAVTEFGYAKNTTLVLFAIGGAFTGAANLFVYRLISKDRGKV